MAHLEQQLNSLNSRLANQEKMVAEQARLMTELLPRLSGQRHPQQQAPPPEQSENLQFAPAQPAQPH